MDLETNVPKIEEKARSDSNCWQNPKVASDTQAGIIRYLGGNGRAKGEFLLTRKDYFTLRSLCVAE